MLMKTMLKAMKIAMKITTTTTKAYSHGCVVDKGFDDHGNKESDNASNNDESIDGEEVQDSDKDIDDNAKG